MAVLEILERENLQKNALDVGTYLIDGIRSIQKDCSIIGDVRGSGFFIAVELVEDRESRNPATNEAINIVNQLKSRGILVNTIGPDNNILKLRPPMVFNYKNADFFLEEFDQIMRT